MSEPITTNNVSEIDDIAEVIGTDGESKNFSNIIKPESVDLDKKIYDPDDIDSVINVVNDADPISKNCPEVDADSAAPAENPEIQNEEPVNTTKIARKRCASSLLTFICAISMVATVAVFAQAIELAHLDLGDMYGRWIAVATAISVIFHMWAHGYIAKTIE